MLNAAGTVTKPGVFLDGAIISVWLFPVYFADCRISLRPGFGDASFKFFAKRSALEGAVRADGHAWRARRAGWNGQPARATRLPAGRKGGSVDPSWAAQ